MPLASPITNILISTLFKHISYLKNVKAHDGAVITVRWSHDGGALVTGGEDGEVKIWSKSGNFRSSIASTGVCVYDCCWYVNLIFRI